jgi:hypothetical protein
LCLDPRSRYKAQSTKYKAQNIYGKEIIDSEGRSETEVFGPCIHALQALWETEGLLAQIQPVSHLFSRIGVAGANPWRREVELVKTLQI